MIAGIVLAAGSGSRFGGTKQLAQLDGIPLLEHALRAIEAVRAIDRIVVVLGARGRDPRGHRLRRRGAGCLRRLEGGPGGHLCSAVDVDTPEALEQLRG